MSLHHTYPDCTGIQPLQLIDELEREVDANLARYKGPPGEPCHFGFAVPARQLPAAMRQILTYRYENAGWSRAWFEEISDNELLFVLEPGDRQRQVLNGSWFGRSSPPPSPPPWWCEWLHRAALLVLWAAVLCLWVVARLQSAQVPG